GHTYTFNHWNHDWVLPHDPDYCWWEPHYDTIWYISVPPENDHNYYVYMSGGPYSAAVVSPDGSEIWNIGEHRYIHWNVSRGADSSSKVDIYLSRDGGSNWDLIMPGLDYDYDGGGYYLWTVTGPPSTHCRVKVTALDCAENTSSDISTKDFIIAVEGNNDPVLDSHLQCKYPQGECGDCIHYGEEVTIEIPAHDPDGDSMFFEWRCPISFGGHFSNGEQTMTTAQNYVTYIAPTKGKDEQKQYFRDLIFVTVTDVRGGQTWAVGEPELHDGGYSCNCGDANDDGVVNSGDVIYLVSYLSKGGPEPVAPWERGDPNNDCWINVGDVTYLVSYLYQGGPQPECCWFPPG
ncbi:MAG: dockerin type I repeat-containing protein, partial [Candidatus Zixiibacteriota bacterium]